MSSMTAPPMHVPSVGSDGSIAAYASKYARNIALTVVEMSGGANGLFEWKNRTPANETDFWTKIYPKTIQKEVEVSDKRSIEDVLSAIDAEFSVVEDGKPRVSQTQDFSNFQPFDASIVVGALDESDEDCQ